MGREGAKDLILAIKRLKIEGGTTLPAKIDLALELCGSVPVVKSMGVAELVYAGGIYEKEKPVKADNLVETVKKLVAEGFGGPPWRSLTACPPKTKFEAQHEKEEILLLMRRHPITNLWWMASIAMLFGVPLFWSEFPLVANVTAPVQLALAIFWYLGLAFFAIQNLLLWFYNVYIVTDERIIDVDFLGYCIKT